MLMITAVNSRARNEAYPTNSLKAAYMYCNWNVSGLFASPIPKASLIDFHRTWLNLEWSQT